MSFISPELVMDIHCSSGTYIRSLASDIGNRLGTGAHLKALRRLKSGSFCVEKAIKSSEIGDGISGDFFKERVISLVDALPEVKEITVDRSTARNIRNGNLAKLEELSHNFQIDDFPGGNFKIVHDKTLVAIMGINRSEKNNNRLVKNIRVFN